MRGEEAFAKDRNFVTALARGLDVLRAFRPNELSLTNTELAVRTGLPKPTVSRLTHTLCQLEYLITDQASGGYRLGPGVLRLGFGVMAATDLRERAEPYMRDLCQGPNSYVTCALGERHLTDVVYVAVSRSTQDVSLTLNVGAMLPVFFSAIGRAILLAMPSDDREAVFDSANRDDPDGRSARLKCFEAAKTEYEQKGYCSGFGDWREDVNGIAVPLVSIEGNRVFGLNVGGPSFHVLPDELHRHYAERLMKAADALGTRP